MFVTGAALPSRFDPLTWHIHEMLFGFVMAAVAGFLLTAIPNWTQRLPVSGEPLALLAGLWLLGRIACLISAFVPPWLATAADLSFPVVLVAVVAREIVAGRNWRNLPMVAPVTVLGIANLLMHLETDGVAVPAGLGWRLGLAAVIVLISVVAGRIVPSFTRNWLAKRRVSSLPAAPGWIDRAALGTLHAGLIGWAFLPDLQSDRPAASAWRDAQPLAAIALAWRRDGRGAAAPHTPYRLRLAGTGCGPARTFHARCRSAVERRHPHSDGWGDRHDDPGGDDACRARPLRTRSVGRSQHQPDLYPRHPCGITRVAAALARVGRCRSLPSRHVFGFPPSEFSRCATGRCCSCRARLTSDVCPLTWRCVQRRS